jgi:hypothetical protein
MSCIQMYCSPDIFALVPAILAIEITPGSQLPHSMPSKRNRAYFFVTVGACLPKISLECVQTSNKLILLLLCRTHSLQQKNTNFKSTIKMNQMQFEPRISNKGNLRLVRTICELLESNQTFFLFKISFLTHDSEMDFAMPFNITPKSPQS